LHGSSIAKRKCIFFYSLRSVVPPSEPLVSSLSSTPSCDLPIFFSSPSAVSPSGFFPPPSPPSPFYAVSSLSNPTGAEGRPRRDGSLSTLFIFKRIFQRLCFSTPRKSLYCLTIHSVRKQGNAHPLPPHLLPFFNLLLATPSPSLPDLQKTAFAPYTLPSLIGFFPQWKVTYYFRPAMCDSGPIICTSPSYYL